ARECSLRDDARPQLDDAIHHFLVSHREAASGRRRFGSYNGSRRYVDGDGPVEPGVQRDVRKERLHASHDAREAGTEARVQRGPDRRMRAGEVVMTPIAVNHHFDAYGDEALARVRVSVEVVFRRPPAVGESSEARAAETLDIVLHRREGDYDRVRTIL